MKTIKLSEFGSALRTRKLAKEIRESADWQTGVVFDFENINLMTHSFSDELFGVLFHWEGETFFKQKIQFKNTSEEIKTIIIRTIQSRKEMKEAS